MGLNLRRERPRVLSGSAPIARPRPAQVWSDRDQPIKDAGRNPMFWVTEEEDEDEAAAEAE